MNVAVLLPFLDFQGQPGSPSTAMTGCWRKPVHSKESMSLHLNSSNSDLSPQVEHLLDLFLGPGAPWPPTTTERVEERRGGGSYYPRSPPRAALPPPDRYLDRPYSMDRWVPSSCAATAMVQLLLSLP